MNFPQGEIRINGRSINDYNLRHFRQSIGVVSQEPVRSFSSNVEPNGIIDPVQYKYLRKYPIWSC